MQPDWPARFADVVRRKTRDALAATLPPLRTMEAGATRDLDAVGNPWTRRLFDGDFFMSFIPGVSKGADDIPATSLVFVQSRDGNTGTVYNFEFGNSSYSLVHE